MKIMEWFHANENFFGMAANLSGQTTGLSQTVWILVKANTFGPRIKVSYDNSLRFDNNNIFSISISDNPQVVAGNTEENVIKQIGKSNLDDIFDWVKLNKVVLEKYWNSNIDTQEILNLLKRVHL